MRRLRPLLVPALTTLVMLAVLIGLGVWQVQRLQWKRALLAQIDAAEKADPVPLPFDPNPLQKVRVEGRWRPDLLAYYGAEVRDTREGGIMGAQALMPLEQANGTVILVDLGWIPMNPKMPATVSRDVVTVVGWLRPSERPGLFSPQDAPTQRRFYTLNAATIGAGLGVAPVLPFVLVQIATEPVEGYPVPNSAMPRPPNDHLVYALTWFGLAGTLLVIYAAYAWRTLHPEPQPMPTLPGLAVDSGPGNNRRQS